MKTRKNHKNNNNKINNTHKPPCIKKLNKSKKKLIKLGCSPNVTHNKEYTCYSKSSLIKLKNLWNERHPDLLIESNDDREIWKSLKDYMTHVCDVEKCWLKQNFIKDKLTDELKNYTFLPETPKKWKTNKNEWLNSLDIERVMQQYEKKHIISDIENLVFFLIKSIIKLLQLLLPREYNGITYSVPLALKSL